MKTYLKHDFEFNNVESIIDDIHQVILHNLSQNSLLSNFTHFDLTIFANCRFSYNTIIDDDKYRGEEQFQWMELILTIMIMRIRHLLWSISYHG